MDVPCAILLIVAVYAVYYYLQLPYTHWKHQNVKCVPGSILGFGHILPILLSRECSSDLITKIYKKYPKVSMVGMYFFRTPAVLVREPELVKRVLVSDFQSFQNNFFHLNPKLDRFLSTNPFFAVDDKWKEYRTELAKNLTQKKLKIFFGIMQQLSVKFDNYLSKVVDKSKVYEDDIRSVLIKFTGELVANTAFGIDAGSFDSQANTDSFTNKLERLVQPSIFSELNLLIVLYLPKLAAALKLRFLTSTLENFYLDNIESIILHRREKGLVQNDLLQMYMDGSDHLDPKDIACKLSGFYFDAYETTATTAAFICVELSHNTTAQNKARSEILEILEKYEGTLTYDALKDLKYLEQVIYEAIRLYPVLGVAYKVCTQKITLEGSDGQSCHLEPGHIAIVPVRGLHTELDYWENPDHFDPDRFNDQLKNSTKFAFMPFGEGPRACTGMRYGLMTLKIAMVGILKNYTIEISSKASYPPKLDPSYPLTQSGEGHFVKLKRIDA